MTIGIAVRQRKQWGSKCEYRCVCVRKKENSGGESRVDHNIQLSFQPVPCHHNMKKVTALTLVMEYRKEKERG